MKMPHKLLEKHQSSSRQRKKRRYFNRDHELGHTCLVKDYFTDDSVFHEDVFRRRFWMKKQLFMHIFEALQTQYEYFQLKTDATKKVGLSSLHKCTVAIR